MGTQEAVAYSVPMIGMPLFADQFTNIDSYVVRNVAVKLHIYSMTEQDLDAALNAVLRDPIYRFPKVKFISPVFRTVLIHKFRFIVASE